MDDRVVATRELDTPDGILRLEIRSQDGEVPAFEYRLVAEDGSIDASTTTYGVDTVQALLFALTAAGDHLARSSPRASFAGLGTTGLLVTDLSPTDVWRASVQMPTRLAED